MIDLLLNESTANACSHGFFLFCFLVPLPFPTPLDSYFFFLFHRGSEGREEEPGLCSLLCLSSQPSKREIERVIQRDREKRARESV